MAAAATSTTPTPAIPPNQSLYLQNLPEKFPKDDLRRELYMLFSPYGPILDITALKTRQMRGQAHILFRDVHAARDALRGVQGVEVGGRGVVSLIPFPSKKSEAEEERREEGRRESSRQRVKRAREERSRESIHVRARETRSLTRARRRAPYSASNTPATAPTPSRN